MPMCALSLSIVQRTEMKEVKMSYKINDHDYQVEDNTCSLEYYYVLQDTCRSSGVKYPCHFVVYYPRNTIHDVQHLIRCQFYMYLHRRNSFHTHTTLTFSILVSRLTTMKCNAISLRYLPVCMSNSACLSSMIFYLSPEKKYLYDDRL